MLSGKGASCLRRELRNNAHREAKALWPSNTRWPGRAPGAAQKRDRSSQIYDGTNQIQRMIIARELLNKGAQV